MTMEAIRAVTAVEEKGRAEKAEAEARVRQAVAEAEREGQSLLQKARREGAEHGRAMLKAAEERAAKAAEETAARARQESDALCSAAKGRLNEAADMIVGRVVKS